MKKIIILSIFAASCFCSTAKSNDEAIQYKNPQVSYLNGTVHISFQAVLSKKAVKNNYTLFVTPSLEEKNRSAKLPVFAVKGRKVAMSDARKQMSGTAEKADNDIKTYLRNGDVYNYSVSVPYQAWMQKVSLKISLSEKGCCATNQGEALLIAENISINEPEPTPVVDVVPEPVEPTPTTGDILAQQHTFVAPMDENMKELLSNPNKQYFNKYVDDIKDNPLNFSFTHGSTKLDSKYNENEKALDNLMMSIRKIHASSDSRITGIIVVGYASPEGSLADNTIYAGGRAEALRNYIVANSDLKVPDITLYNGTEYWTGLRELVVASDMPDKMRVLKIIDTYPVWDSAKQVGRMGTIMRLNGGNTYRYMYKYFFPKLRNNAAQVEVYYENVK